MFTFLTMLLALISVMFVTSMVAEMRREDEEFKAMIRRDRAF
ncbi:hypothetical protein O9X94_17250 [Agrobacterium leguminum]|uniref:Uncharacterized protein n=1 Tax=Agrobacterium leguminum TaxID=2792015 RepID=A0A9X3KG26_9HYPH|nr:hypothetical protein [Agrobacterium leguminum]MCZ7911070.1 hypothetical protein [Agrobacterium leguminum]